jgi:hypothetical protein
MNKNESRDCEWCESAEEEELGHNGREKLPTLLSSISEGIVSHINVLVHFCY